MTSRRISHLWKPAVLGLLCASLAAQRPGSTPGSPPTPGGSRGPTTPPTAPGGGWGPGSGGGYGCPAAGGGSSRPRSPWNGPGDAGPTTPAPSTPATGRPTAPYPTAPTTPSAPTLPRTPDPAWFYPETAGAAARPDWSAWWVWWGFNRDNYLTLEGELARRPGSAADAKGDSIAEGFRMHAAPTFSGFVREGGKTPVLREALLAAARARPDAVPDSQVSRAARHFLGQGHLDLRTAAVLSLGVRRNTADADFLLEILADDDTARAVCAVDYVPERTRAMAAYALGLIATDTDHEVRERIARGLLEGLAVGTDELRVACALALGHVALPACTGDTYELGDGPHVCTAVEVDVLAGTYVDETERLELRAHALTAAARRATAFDQPEQRQRFAHLLVWNTREIDDLDVELVRSAVLAMGIFADGDGDAPDQSVRRELVRLVKKGPRDVRGLALISLAQATARGDASPAAVKTTTDLLLNELARGRDDRKAWAAVALGVFGNRLASSGGRLDDAVAFGLREQMTRSRSGSEAAACALGLTLIRDEHASTKKALLKRYQKAKNPFVRAFVAQALGVLSVGEARAELQLAMDEGEMSAALALHSMGGAEVVTELIAALEQSALPSAALVRTLARCADARAVAPLGRFLANENEDVKLRALAAQALGELVDDETAHWTSQYAADVNYRALTWSLFSPLTGEGLFDCRPAE